MDDPKPIYDAMGNKYQVIYDRMFDRAFKGQNLVDAVGELQFAAPQEGLRKCLTEFFVSPRFRGTPNLAAMDRLAGERTKLSEIQGTKQKLEYVAVRYLPGKTANYLGKVKSTVSNR